MEHRTELFRLLSALADGQLSPPEHDRLEELLANRDARRLYLEYVDLHARLLTHPDLAGDHRLPGVDALAGVIGDEAAAQIAAPASRSGPANTTTVSPSGRRLKRVRRIASYGAVAIATVAATMLVQLYVGRPQPPVQQAEQPTEPESYVATLAEAADVEWGAPTEFHRPGSRLLAGDLEVKRGIARIGFDSSVELIVEGPARLRLESSNSATIITGKVVFRADDAAAPFTLRTPTSVLVDLGDRIRRRSRHDAGRGARFSLARSSGCRRQRRRIHHRSCWRRAKRGVMAAGRVTLANPRRSSRRSLSGNCRQRKQRLIRRPGSWPTKDSTTPTPRRCETTRAAAAWASPAPGEAAYCARVGSREPSMRRSTTSWRCTPQRASSGPMLPRFPSAARSSTWASASIFASWQRRCGSMPTRFTT